MPALHVLQATAPGAAANEPALQWLQEFAWAELDQWPAEHSLHCDAALPEYVPALHSSQELAAGLAVNDPALQVLHESAWPAPA